MQLDSLLKKYLLLEQEEDDHDIVFDMMVDLINTLEPDDLSEDQQDMLGNILNELGLLEDDEEEDDEDEDDLSERKIMKVKRKAHLLMKKAYKRNKAKFKMMNKKYRKTSAFKKWKKKHKRMVKMGRTKTKRYV